MTLKNLTLRIMSLTILTCVFVPAEAARVEKVKGKQVLIDSESLEMNEGEKFFIVIDGKKKGVVKIDKVKNGKALGKLTKGKAVVDAAVEPVRKANSDASAEPSDPDAAPADGTPSEEDILSKSRKKKRKKRASSDHPEPGLYIGVMAGYAMDSQTVKDPSGASVSMTGSGYSLKVYGDMPISGGLGIIGRGGIEQINLAGHSNSLGDVTTAIMYLTGDMLLRYSFSESNFQPFGALGLGFHMPLSKSSGILDVPRISTTTVFFGDLGFNYMMGTSMLTLAFEYGMFPPSNDVSTSLMTLRAGWAWHF